VRYTDSTVTEQSEFFVRAYAYALNEKYYTEDKHHIMGFGDNGNIANPWSSDVIRYAPILSYTGSDNGEYFTFGGNYFLASDRYSARNAYEPSRTGDYIKVIDYNNDVLTTELFNEYDVIGQLTLNTLPEFLKIDTTLYDIRKSVVVADKGYVYKLAETIDGAGEEQATNPNNFELVVPGTNTYVSNVALSEPTSTRPSEFFVDETGKEIFGLDVPEGMSCALRGVVVWTIIRKNKQCRVRFINEAGKLLTFEAITTPTLEVRRVDGAYDVNGTRCLIYYDSDVSYVELTNEAVVLYRRVVDYYCAQPYVMYDQSGLYAYSYDNRVVYSPLKDLALKKLEANVEVYELDGTLVNTEGIVLTDTSFNVTHMNRDVFERVVTYVKGSPEFKKTCVYDEDGVEYNRDVDLYANFNFVKHDDDRANVVLTVDKTKIVDGRVNISVQSEGTASSYNYTDTERTNLETLVVNANQLQKIDRSKLEKATARTIAIEEANSDIIKSENVYYMRIGAHGYYERDFVYHTDVNLTDVYFPERYYKTIKDSQDSPVANPTLYELVEDATVVGNTIDGLKYRYSINALEALKKGLVYVLNDGFYMLVVESFPNTEFYLKVGERYHYHAAMKNITKKTNITFDELLATEAVPTELRAMVPYVPGTHTDVPLYIDETPVYDEEELVNAANNGINIPLQKVVKSDPFVNFIQTEKACIRYAPSDYAEGYVVADAAYCNFLGLDSDTFVGKRFVHGADGVYTCVSKVDGLTLVGNPNSTISYVEREAYIKSDKLHNWWYAKSYSDGILTGIVAVKSEHGLHNHKAEPAAGGGYKIINNNNHEVTFKNVKYIGFFTDIVTFQQSPYELVFEYGDMIGLNVLACIPSTGTGEEMFDSYNKATTPENVICYYKESDGAGKVKYVMSDSEMHDARVFTTPHYRVADRGAESPKLTFYSCASPFLNPSYLTPQHMLCDLVTGQMFSIIAFYDLHQQRVIDDLTPYHNRLIVKDELLIPITKITEGNTMNGYKVVDRINTDVMERYYCPMNTNAAFIVDEMDTIGSVKIQKYTAPLMFGAHQTSFFKNTVDIINNLTVQNLYMANKYNGEFIYCRYQLNIQYLNTPSTTQSGTPYVYYSAILSDTYRRELSDWYARNIEYVPANHIKNNDELYMQLPTLVREYGIGKSGEVPVIELPLLNNPDDHGEVVFFNSVTDKVDNIIYIKVKNLKYVSHVNSYTLTSEGYDYVYFNNTYNYRNVYYDFTDDTIFVPTPKGNAYKVHDQDVYLKFDTVNTIYDDLYKDIIVYTPDSNGEYVKAGLFYKPLNEISSERYERSVSYVVPEASTDDGFYYVKAKLEGSASVEYIPNVFYVHATDNITKVTYKDDDKNVILPIIISGKSSCTGMSYTVGVNCLVSSYPTIPDTSVISPVDNTVIRLLGLSVGDTYMFQPGVNDDFTINVAGQMLKINGFASIDYIRSLHKDAPLDPEFEAKLVDTTVNDSFISYNNKVESVKELFKTTKVTTETASEKEFINLNNKLFTEQYVFNTNTDMFMIDYSRSYKSPRPMSIEYTDPVTNNVYTLRSPYTLSSGSTSNQYSYICAPFDGDHDTAVVPITEHVDMGACLTNLRDYRHNSYIVGPPTKVTSKVGMSSEFTKFTGVFDLDPSKDPNTTYLQKSLDVMRRENNIVVEYMPSGHNVDREFFAYIVVPSMVYTESGALEMSVGATPTLYDFEYDGAINTVRYSSEGLEINGSVVATEGYSLLSYDIMASEKTLNPVHEVNKQYFVCFILYGKFYKHESVYPVFNPNVREGDDCIYFKNFKTSKTVLYRARSIADACCNKVYDRVPIANQYVTILDVENVTLCLSELPDGRLTVSSSDFISYNRLSNNGSEPTGNHVMQVIIEPVTSTTDSVMKFTPIERSKLFFDSECKIPYEFGHYTADEGNIFTSGRHVLVYDTLTVKLDSANVYIKEFKELATPTLDADVYDSKQRNIKSLEIAVSDGGVRVPATKLWMNNYDGRFEQKFNVTASDVDAIGIFIKDAENGNHVFNDEKYTLYTISEAAFLDNGYNILTGRFDSTRSIATIENGTLTLGDVYLSTANALYVTKDDVTYEAAVDGHFVFVDDALIPGLSQNLHGYYDIFAIFVKPESGKRVTKFYNEKYTVSERGNLYYIAPGSYNNITGERSDVTENPGLTYYRNEVYVGMYVNLADVKLGTATSKFKSLLPSAISYKFFDSSQSSFQMNVPATVNISSTLAKDLPVYGRREQVIYSLTSNENGAITLQTFIHYANYHEGAKIAESTKLYKSANMTAENKAYYRAYDLNRANVIAVQRINSEDIVRNNIRSDIFGELEVPTTLDSKYQISNINVEGNLITSTPYVRDSHDREIGLLYNTKDVYTYTDYLYNTTVNVNAANVYSENKLSAYAFNNDVVRNNRYTVVNPSYYNLQQKYCEFGPVAFTTSVKSVNNVDTVIVECARSENSDKAPGDQYFMFCLYDDKQSTLNLDTVTTVKGSRRADNDDNIKSTFKIVDNNTLQMTKFKHNLDIYPSGNIVVDFKENNFRICADKRPTYYNVNIYNTRYDTCKIEYGGHMFIVKTVDSDVPMLSTHQYLLNVNSGLINTAAINSFTPNNLMKYINMDNVNMKKINVNVIQENKELVYDNYFSDIISSNFGNVFNIRSDVTNTQTLFTTTFSCIPVTSDVVRTTKSNFSSIIKSANFDTDYETVFMPKYVNYKHNSYSVVENDAKHELYNMLMGSVDDYFYNFTTDDDILQKLGFIAPKVSLDSTGLLQRNGEDVYLIKGKYYSERIYKGPVKIQTPLKYFETTMYAGRNIRKYITLPKGTDIINRDVDFVTTFFNKFNFCSDKQACLSIPSSLQVKITQSDDVEKILNSTDKHTSNSIALGEYEINTRSTPPYANIPQSFNVNANIELPIDGNIYVYITSPNQRYPLVNGDVSMLIEYT
jgi:hypothetical protein